MKQGSSRKKKDVPETRHQTHRVKISDRTDTSVYILRPFRVSLYSTYLVDGTQPVHDTENLYHRVLRTVGSLRAR